MDRLNQLRATAGSSRDSTLDTSSPPSEGFVTANESSSKYYSLSEDDSTFDISPVKEVSLATVTTEPDELITNLSPIGKKADVLDYKIGKQIEAANILSGGVDIFEDNDNSNDGDGLVIDDNAGMDDDKSLDSSMHPFPKDEVLIESETAIPSKETEVALQIDGKNVDAIDIGNGLYLYRKEGQEELAAVQIVEDEQQHPSFKFLKVRENSDGNLEVYEEIEVEVPKEAPVKEKKTSHVPIEDISKVFTDNSNKTADKKSKIPIKETTAVSVEKNETEVSNDTSDSKSEVNFNGKMVKFSEARKSPLIGTFTPMTFHSTPNKEGIPLTKTMVDQQLHPSRHSDNVKKTIEVHTDSCKSKLFDTSNKNTSNSSEESKIAEQPESIESNPLIVDMTECTKDKNTEELNVFELKIADNSTTKVLVSDISLDNVSKSAIEKREVNLPMPPEIKISEQINDDDSLNYCKSNESAKGLDIEKIVQVDEMSKSKQNDETKSNLSASLKTTPEPNNDSKDKETVEKSCLISIAEKCIIKDASSELANVDEPKEEVAKKIFVNEDKTIVDNETITDKIEVEQTFDKPTPVIIQNVDNSKSFTKEETLKQSPIALCENNRNIIEEKSLNFPNPVPILKTDDADLKDCVLEKMEVDNLPILAKIEPANCKHASDLNEVQEKLIDSTSNLSNVNSEQKYVQNVTITTSNSSELTKNTPDRKPSELQKYIPHKFLKPETREKPQTLTKAEITVSERPSVPKVSEIHINKPEVQEVSKLMTEISSKHEKTSGFSIKSHNADLKIENLEIRTKAIPNDDVKSEKIMNKDTTKTEFNIEPHQKYINNNHAPVPFGKWTEVNRQDFLNKIKEARIPSNSSTANQIKQTKDLNSRDILKKMDTQRQSNIAIAKAAEIAKATEIAKASEISKAEELEKTTKALIYADEAITADDVKDSEVAKAIHHTKPADIVKAAEKPKQTHIPTASASNVQKLNIKNESTINPKKQTTTDNKRLIKSERFETKYRVDKKLTKQEAQKNQSEQLAASDVAKNENLQRKAYNNQDLIDKTIEGIINRAVCGKIVDDTKKVDVKDNKGSHCSKNAFSQNPPTKTNPPPSLDAIEMKMNELHGIPFIERPPHELPILSGTESKSLVKTDSKIPKTDKIPNLVPLSNKIIQKTIKANAVDFDSEEEIIEHEPITGDIEIKKNNIVNLNKPQKLIQPQIFNSTQIINEKKEAIITEKDFDKFARRNSITYENCLTVNLGRESHNVVQTVVKKDNAMPKNYSRNKTLLAEAKARSPQKYSSYQPATYASKVPLTAKVHPIHDGLQMSFGNPSKVQMAYQSLTSKRQIDNPITIIEDKPVKVVFMDSSTDYIPRKLDIQGKELSPAKKPKRETDSITISTGDSVDSETYDSVTEDKSQDDIKVKAKHQRKQVLTPVDNSDLELIEPTDLGIETSPRKKRRIEEKPKNISNKKSYLLSHNSIVADNKPKLQTVDQKSYKEQNEQITIIHNNAASAIDSLVKAAELLENQSENMNAASILTSGINSSLNNSENLDSTPVKRGRGRPRKYPLPDGAADRIKLPSPQKKPRLIDAKKKKIETSSEDDITSDEEMIRENWTMGKINEKIVCPICNKLFRSENVVFKHVKHCTGPSPSRSGSDNRSPRRSRQSQESENYSHSSKSDVDLDDEPLKTVQETLRRKSKEEHGTAALVTDNIIVIEDTPIKEKPKEPKEHISRKLTVKTKAQIKVDSLECEFCGKKFRQLSYLVNHKLQHKKEQDAKKSDDVPPATSSSILSCDVCKKDFRKLHHLVQHRVIHNPPSAMPQKAQRKISSELIEPKKTQETSQQHEDTSAGFRCEPCDKSFRKLHHLVEHRETHDGINRQKNTPAVQTVVEKPAPPPQCEICKKTFRKLHHLIEHKEQHNETNSEKSTDKSVRSSLSTKDIIHECNLCYMVFPNEHSLNKHHGICLRKKRQSALKQSKQENDETKTDDESSKIGSENIDDQAVLVDTEDAIEKQEEELQTSEEIVGTGAASLPFKGHEEVPKELEAKRIEIQPVAATIDPTLESWKAKKAEIIAGIPSRVKKVEEKVVTNMQEMSMKKTPGKEKAAMAVTKRQKSTTPSLPINDDRKASKPSVIPEASGDDDDDDEIRYMLNPDFKVDENVEAKLFMKVRANKRSSLQIERPSSKDLVKRRTSLQHPPKIPRLKTKPVVVKPISSRNQSEEVEVKPKSVPALSTHTDSDDSDVKYSFPKPVPDKTQKPTAQNPVPKEAEKKVIRKSMAEKRKSLSAIAKRKSMGKIGTPKLKATPVIPVVKEIKRRTTVVEHRCDCGQLFGSAALLTRHTSLAHTPPRRRRRSPAPPPSAVPPSLQSQPPPQSNKRKSSVKSDTKSSAPKSNQKTPTTESRKKATDAKTASKSTAKSRRTAAHRGVPVPEKMRKLMEKSTK